MSISLIICCLLWCWTEPCQPANHYCVNGHTMNIRIGGRYHKDETIIPDIPDEPKYKRGSYRHCSWEITADETGNHNSQIVLEGVKLETADLSGSSNKTHVNISLNRGENVTLGMFQVKPLSQRSHISVQINWDPKTQSRSPVNLRILIPVAGVCSRDMLSFNDNCHAISTVPADIMKTVEYCSGDAMLASFTSMAHINEFIASNEARENVFPNVFPLDLSEWVRLGMFNIDGAILSVVKTDIGCHLKEVDKNLFQVSKLNGACGSLRVDAFGKAELQFGNCDQRMKALMSFPEVATTSGQICPFNCSKTLLPKLQQLLFSPPKDSESKTTNDNDSFTNPKLNIQLPKYQQPAATEVYLGRISSDFSHMSIWYIIIGVSSGIGLLLVAIVLLTYFLRIRKRRELNDSKTSPSKTGIQTGSLRVATPAIPKFHGQLRAGSSMKEEDKQELPLLDAIII